MILGFSKNTLNILLILLAVEIGIYNLWRKTVMVITGEGHFSGKRLRPFWPIFSKSISKLKKLKKN